MLHNKRIFDLDSRHLVRDTRVYRSESDVNKSAYYALKPEIVEWLEEHKAPYFFREIDRHARLYIDDNKLAMLFKLAWL